MGSSSLTRELNLNPLHWEHEVLAAGPLGKSSANLFGLTSYHCHYDLGTLSFRVLNMPNFLFHSFVKELFSPSHPSDVHLPVTILQSPSTTTSLKVDFLCFSLSLTCGVCHNCVVSVRTKLNCRTAVGVCRELETCLLWKYI